MSAISLDVRNLVKIRSQGASLQLYNYVKYNEFVTFCTFPFLFFLSQSVTWYHCYILSSLGISLTVKCFLFTSMCT